MKIGHKSNLISQSTHLLEASDPVVRALGDAPENVVRGLAAADENGTGGQDAAEGGAARLPPLLGQVIYLKGHLQGGQGRGG